MTTTDTSTTRELPAAWYRDPSGRHERRWWDGQAWTDKVADGTSISADAPVRSQPVETEPVSTQPEDEAADGDGEPSFDQLGKARVPVEERATTAPRSGPTLNVRGLVVGGIGLAIVIAAVLWGVTNRATAADWRERGEELQEELLTVSSNADALEDALARSANRAARLGDGQEAFREVEDAAIATTDQLNACVHDVDLVLRTLAVGQDPTTELERASLSCGQAQANNIVLRDLLTAIAGQ